MIGKIRIWQPAGALLLALPFVLASTAQAAGPAATAKMRKVIAEKGVIERTSPGVHPWYDYGSYALYKLDEATLARLPAAVRAQFTDASQMDRILFDRHAIDTTTAGLAPPPLLASKGGNGPGLQLVQFVGPIRQE